MRAGLFWEEPLNTEKPTAEAVQTFIQEAAKRADAENVEIVENPYFLAGLLYDRYKDGSKRYVSTYREPAVCVITFEDKCVPEVRIPVSDAAIQALAGMKWIEGIQMEGFKDERRQKLTSLGRSKTLDFLQHDPEPHERPMLA